MTKVVLMQVKRPEIVTRIERRGQARKRSKAIPSVAMPPMQMTALLAIIPQHVLNFDLNNFVSVLAFAIIKNSVIFSCRISNRTCLPATPPIILKALSQLQRLLPTTCESFDLKAEVPWIGTSTCNLTGNWGVRRPLYYHLGKITGETRAGHG